MVNRHQEPRKETPVIGYRVKTHNSPYEFKHNVEGWGKLKLNGGGDIDLVETLDSLLYP